MLSAIIALLMNAPDVAFPPPSSYDAYVAFTDRLIDEEATGQETTRRLALSYPAAVILERCVRRESSVFNEFTQSVARVGGYNCIQEIVPNASPSFRNTGFYTILGGEWTYFGATQANRIPSLREFDPPSRTPYRLKNGSIPYEGNPANSFNEQNDPYQDLFKKLDPFWFDQGN